MSLINKTHILSMFLGIIFIPNLIYGQRLERWQFISSNDNGSRSYLENSNRKSTGGKKQTWTKDIFKDGSYKITLIEWQCREKKFRILEATNYAPAGTYLGQEPASEWSTVVPDSVSENFFKTVCASNQSANESDSSNVRKSVQIISENANVRESPFPVSPVIQTFAKGVRLFLADEEPVGAWYQVLIPDSNQTGWLHGDTIKILKAAPSHRRVERQSKPTRKRRTKK